MFQKNNLYEYYRERSTDVQFSKALPEITKKATLNNINNAINLCDYWNASLDIGCGIGHYTTALSAKFKKCVGVEIDIMPEQQILRDTYKNIEIFNGRIEDYQSDTVFDFILLADIFEHIPDIKGFVRKISSLQKAGGIVHILTPNPIFCGPASESTIFHTKSDYHGHIKHYTRKEIESLMHEGGYEIELYFYEESEKRQIIKRIGKGFSRRDKAYEHMVVYKILRPFILLFLIPLFKLMEILSLWIEKRNSASPFSTMAQVLVFKKI